MRRCKLFGLVIIDFAVFIQPNRVRTSDSDLGQPRRHGTVLNTISWPNESITVKLAEQRAT